MRWMMLVTQLLLPALLLGNAHAESQNEVQARMYQKLWSGKCESKASIAKCPSPEAQVMKGYVTAMLDTGAGETEVFYRVAKKYSPAVILDDKIRVEMEQRISAEYGGKLPKVTFTPASFDFGAVDRSKGKIKKVFTLSNRGNAPLIIRNIRANCPCVNASLKKGSETSPAFDTKGAPAAWQMTIDEGQQAELEVVLDLNDASVKAGKLIRMIAVTSNDMLNKEGVIQIHADVKGNSR